LCSCFLCCHCCLFVSFVCCLFVALLTLVVNVTLMLLTGDAIYLPITNLMRTSLPITMPIKFLPTCQFLPNYYGLPLMQCLCMSAIVICSALFCFVCSVLFYLYCFCSLLVVIVSLCYPLANAWRITMYCRLCDYLFGKLLSLVSVLLLLLFLFVNLLSLAC
jgi:hypothetical protein